EPAPSHPDTVGGVGIAATLAQRVEVVGSIVGVDTTTGEDVCASHEIGVEVAPQHEHLEPLGAVTQQDDRRGVAEIDLLLGELHVGGELLVRELHGRGLWSSGRFCSWPVVSCRPPPRGTRKVPTKVVDPTVVVPREPTLRRTRGRIRARTGGRSRSRPMASLMKPGAIISAAAKP